MTAINNLYELSGIDDTQPSNFQHEKTHKNSYSKKKKTDMK